MSLFKKKIFILTGAGISKESGIKTFRENDGLWDNYRIEDVCTPEAFIRNPDYVNNFYNERRRIINDSKIKPNKAHKSLAMLEQECTNDFMLVTQNIDNLHEKAGSKKIFHMHGSIDKSYCMNCNFVFEFKTDISTSDICKNCNMSGNIRVDVVWFGEQPKYLDIIYSFLKKTDIFMSIGTSNNVYPAAGFIDYLKQLNKKARLIEFNIEKTSKSILFDEIYTGNATKTLPEFVKKII